MRYYTQQDREKVKSVIEELFRLRRLPSHIWAYANGDNHDKVDYVKVYLQTAEVEDGPLEAGEGLERSLRDIVHAERLRVERGEIGIVPFTLEEPEQESQSPKAEWENYDDVTEEDAVLLRVVTQFLILKAVQSKAFRQFRSDYLPHGPLNPDARNKFLMSPALRLFSLAQLRAWDFDTYSHTSVLVSEEQHTHGDRIDFTVKFWPAGELKYVSHHAGEMRQVNPHLVVPSGNAEAPWHPVWTFPGTALDELRSLSVTMAERYGWEARQVIDLLLTDRLLRYPHILVYNRGRNVSLTVPRIISAASLSRVFQSLQKQHSQQRRRLPSSKSLAVFSFVTRAKRTLGVEGQLSLSQRQSIYEEWNQYAAAKPEWRYDSVRLFMQGYTRAEGALERLLAQM